MNFPTSIHLSNFNNSSEIQRIFPFFPIAFSDYMYSEEIFIQIGSPSKDHLRRQNILYKGWDGSERYIPSQRGAGSLGWFHLSTFNFFRSFLYETYKNFNLYGYNYKMTFNLRINNIQYDNCKHKNCDWRQVLKGLWQNIYGDYPLDFFLFSWDESLFWARIYWDGSKFQTFNLSNNFTISCIFWQVTFAYSMAFWATSGLTPYFQTDFLNIFHIIF